MPEPTGTELLSRELLLTKTEAARVLRVSEDTVCNLHRVGALPAIKIGRSLRWSPESVRRYVAELGDSSGT